MKRSSIAICAILLLSSIALVAGQRVKPVTLTFSADVPFDFMVQRVMFPAGKYVVRETSRGMLSVKAQRGLEAVSVSSEAIEKESHSQTPSLVFVNENGHLHLREVWMSSRLGRELPGTTEQLRTASLSRVEVSGDCDRCE